MENYNRDHIKRRMLRRVSTLWDIEDMDNVDPIIGLLIEAMSEEMFRLAGEVGNMDDRMLAKLSASLSPVEYATPRPCHALMKACTLEGTQRIGLETVFSYRESKMVRRLGLDHIDFIPVSSFTVAGSTLCYTGLGTRMYKSAGGFRKSLLAVARHNDKALGSSVWLGLNTGSGHVDELSVYFDFSDLGDKYRYLDLLPLSRWSVNGRAVGFRGGLPVEPEQAPYLRHPLHRLLADIRGFYDKHYITVTGIDGALLETFPKELADYYSEEDIRGFTEPLLWIRIGFPDAVPEEILDRLRVAINVFPVANIGRRKASQKMGDTTLFMPLETPANEFFVAMEKVSDSSGEIYHPLNRESYMNSDRNCRSYTLRQGGVEQHSSTNETMSTVSRLIDILKDRNLFNNARISSEFSKTMSEIVNSSNLLSRIMEGLPADNQIKSYLLVDRNNSREILTARYYTTNGAAIAGFKFSEALTSGLDFKLNKELTRLITPVKGGYNNPPAEHVRDIHRYMLTSSGRIFTKEDIKNFIYAGYSGHVDKIAVQNGSMVSTKPNEGIVRTIDVTLSLNAGSALNKTKEDFKTELVSKLKSHSPESFNYRVIID